MMARGGGGKQVFEEDKDRYGDDNDEVGLRELRLAGAGVLMGNHFHFLIETPQLSGKQFYIPARTVPNAQDRQCGGLIVDFVNDPIEGDDQFPQALLPLFGNDSANPRERLK